MHGWDNYNQRIVPPWNITVRKFISLLDSETCPVSPAKCQPNNPSHVNRK